MALHVARYGPREYAKACDRARDNVGDGTNMTHVVEVFDEETERDEREGVDLGVLYVVEYKHLDEFLGQHTEAAVQETFGFTLEEDG